MTYQARLESVILLLYCISNTPIYVMYIEIQHEKYASVYLEYK